MLGRVWCFLPLNSGEHQCFGLAFHSVVTLRAFWYAPPGYVRIKFDTGCLRIATVNRTCGRNYYRFFLLAGQFLVRRHQTASPGKLDRRQPGPTRAGEHCRSLCSFSKTVTASLPSSALRGSPCQGAGAERLRVSPPRWSNGFPL